MSDDSRRPGDDKPTDPPTGEGEVVGADWLLSQLGSEQTGEIALPPGSDTGSTTTAPSEARGDAAAGKKPGPAAGAKPVLAWWREKLVAADALVNPEPRADTPDEDEAVLPEPGWTARSNSDRTGPALFESRRRNAPEPEPQSEPQPEPEPDVVPPVAGDEGHGWSLAAESDIDEQPEDEPETGLIPMSGPPLFKPRSARDIVAAEAAVVGPAEPAEPENSEAPEPDKPEAALVEPAATMPTAAPLPPTELLAGAATPEQGTAPAADEDADVDDDDDDDDDDDLEPFSWSLMPNDQLDPLVHRQADGQKPVTSGSDAAGPDDAGPDDAGAGDADLQQTAAFPAAVLPPASAASAAAAARPATPIEPQPREEAGHPPRRMRRETADDTAPEPVIVPAASPDEPQPPRPARPWSAGGGARPPRALLWGALALVAVIVIAGLFFLGSRLPSLLAGPASTPTTSAAPTPTTEAAAPTPTVAPPAGPAAAGEQKWTALTGGECVDPYSTPWAETFTVVDCAAPHAAQMVFSAPVDADPAAAYPGEDVILSQINLWCSAPGVLDAAAAGGYSDLQVQGAYPVSAEQWANGERNYFCFVNRSGGEPLTSSVAVPRA